MVNKMKTVNLILERKLSLKKYNMRTQNSGKVDQNEDMSTLKENKEHYDTLIESRKSFQKYSVNILKNEFSGLL